jgi:carbon-monoxide dehydrogenase catalytic subunit
MVSKRLVRKEKTCDAGAKEGIEIATADRNETARDRFDKIQPQCTFGEPGLCCDHCPQGPCRINSFRGKPDKGICGARDYTVVARNLVRHIAGGTSAHSSHGWHIAETMVKVLEGKARTSDDSPMSL